MKPVSDQAMRQHATLLGQLAAPEIPRELRERSFYEGIVERASESVDPAVTQALASLRPLEAPQDVCWQDLEEVEGMSDRVEAALPGPQHARTTPGWVWTRIREDLHEEARAARSRGLRARISSYAAAALVIVSLALGTTFLVSKGTNESPEIVFREDPGLHSATDGLFGRRF